MPRAKTDQERFPEDYFLSPHGHPRDRIQINESADLPSEGVFISLNGYAFLAKPGMVIDLPRPVRIMLDTRIQTNTQQINGVDHHRHVPRVSYRLIQENVEIAAAEQPQKQPQGEA